MTVIPASVIADWLRQYDDASPLWTKYPEIDPDTIRELVQQDEPLVRQLCLECVSPNPNKGTSIYVATAGAPLAGKSTILDQVLAANPDRYNHVVRVDPDRWGMLFMVHTYHAYLMAAGTIAKAPDFQTAQMRAYDVARPASNFITLGILNEAVGGRYDIAHGTTMTSPHVRALLGGIKQNGYEIDLLLCGAEDDMRADAQEYRARVQGYYQSTPQEVISKGIDFPQRMPDYFELADNLTIFWRNGVTENAIEAATYTNGQRTILNQTAYDHFVDKYERDRVALANPARGNPVILPPFPDIEQTYFERYKRPTPGSIPQP